jgi:hypothetical protein
MSGGVTVWNDQALVAPPSTSQTGPNAAVYSANGTFITAWAEFDPALNRTVMKTKIIDFDGRVLREPFVISSTDAGGGGLVSPSVAVLANGQVVVTYSGGTATDGRVYRTVIDSSSGNTRFVEQQVNSLVTGSVKNPEIVPITSGPNAGGYTLFWEANRDIKGQVYTINGAKSGSEFRVNTPTNTQNSTQIETDLVVTRLSDGRSVMAYQYLSQGDDPETGEYTITGLRYRLVNADGTIGAEISIRDDAAIMGAGAAVLATGTRTSGHR